MLRKTHLTVPPDAPTQRMANQHDASGNAETASTFRQLGERHKARAAKIAALLPP